jgi:putative methionine-R-sulfoxide reductase with GAF domain
MESLESAASIIAVLDIDSAIVNDFDLTDKRWLEKICQKMAS